MVASLIPLFRYEYGDDIRKYFKPDAWEMHEDTYWDPELQVAVTPDDRCVDNIAEQDPEYQWAEEGIKVKIMGVSKRPDPKERSLYGDDGGDSVSTFRTGGASMQGRLEDAAKQDIPKVSTGAGTPITPGAMTQQGEASIFSTSSITSTLDGTVESRISSLESVAEQTNLMMQNMMKMFEKFTKTEEKRAEIRQQTKEVVTTMDQYNVKTSHDEEQE
jgi:hypothetical protein